ncbi:MAG: hypothetical protein KDE27_07400, partial [Planctomycetes bacterium]|nr:hypothetical protein [Planctomycetota bacterium]
MIPLTLRRRRRPGLPGLAILLTAATVAAQHPAPPIGVEIAVPRHLSDGEEYTVPLRRLLRHGQTLFRANWTNQEGG